MPPLTPRSDDLSTSTGTVFCPWHRVPGALPEEPLGARPPGSGGPGHTGGTTTVSCSMYVWFCPEGWAACGQLQGAPDLGSSTGHSALPCPSHGDPCHRRLCHVHLSPCPAGPRAPQTLGDTAVLQATWAEEAARDHWPSESRLGPRSRDFANAQMSLNGDSTSTASGGQGCIPPEHGALGKGGVGTSVHVWAQSPGSGGRGDLSHR